MKKYKIQPTARNDLKSIRLYTIKKYGLSQSHYYRQRLISCIENLSENPRIGRDVMGVGHNIRRFEIEKHIVFYKVDVNAITIIRILHQSIDFLQALE